MPLIRLILDPEGAAVDVDDTMLIGNCATQLAAQLGYPLSDSSGAPVIYQLRLAASGSLLPNDQRFRDLHLAYGVGERSLQQEPLPRLRLPASERAWPWLWRSGIWEDGDQQRPLSFRP